MSVEDLEEARKRVIGSKQTLRALEKDQARLVFLAQDADPVLQKKIQDACQEKGVPIEGISTMVALAQIVNIEVKTAAATILR